MGGVHALRIETLLAFSAIARFGAARKRARRAARRTRDAVAATRQQAAVGAVIRIDRVLVIAGLKNWLSRTDVASHQTVAAACDDAPLEAAGCVGVRFALVAGFKIRLARSEIGAHMPIAADR